MEKKIKPKIIVLDGIGFTNDHANKYYTQIRKKKEKTTLKTTLQSILNLA
jgi:hypothetical protein